MKKCQSKCLLKSLLMPLDDESKDLLAHTETKITAKNEERAGLKPDRLCSEMVSAFVKSLTFVFCAHRLKLENTSIHHLQLTSNKRQSKKSKKTFNNDQKIVFALPPFSNDCDSLCG